MFLMMGTAEKAGSGVNKILSGWSSSHWRRPYVITENEPDRIILEMPMFSIIPDETLSDLKHMFGTNVETLGKDELTALAVCHIEGDITNIRLQYLVDKHKTDITKMLQDLCKNGYLVSENKSRWTTYHLNYSDNLDSSKANLDSSKANLDSSDNVVTTESIDNNLDSAKANLDSFKTNLDSLSNSMDSNKKQTRVKYEILEQEIIGVCLLDYKSAAQIASEIGKTEKYLKNDILPKMISNEKLTKLYPDNHPNQKYIAKK